MDRQAFLFRAHSVAPSLILLQASGGSPGTVLDFVAEITTHAPVPCIVFGSDCDQIDQRVHGLENGIDDWIAVGTTPREVLARVRAVLRRCRPSPGAGATPRRTGPPARAHGWHLSVKERELFKPDGSRCQLTAAEFDLLRPLVQSEGVAVPREALSQAVFRRPWYPDDRGIDNLVARLRRKLSSHSGNSNVIRPVRGVGYVFTKF